MAGLGARIDPTVNKIRSMASSESDGMSIPNIRRELADSGDDPGWTRPFASVKYVNRKDI